MIELPRVTILRSGWLSGAHCSPGTLTSACGLCLAVIGSLLALAPAASASASAFTWSGEAAKGSPGWSEIANWQGGIVPSASGPVALDFPRLTGGDCTGSSATRSCYLSRNDVEGLAVESLTIDDGDEYELEGDALRLGTGGLTASPASGSLGEAGDIFSMPLELTAAQSWSIAARGDGEAGENGVLLEEGVSGPGDALTVGLTKNAALVLAGDSEVGAFTVDGSSSTLVELDGELNAGDGSEVVMSGVPLIAEARVGALRSSGAVAPFPRIEAASATLGSGGGLLLTIAARGDVAGSDYSTLTARGTVDLQSPSLAVDAVTAGCEPLPVGSNYTIVSTSGTLEGSFGNAAEGAKVPIVTAEKCLRRQFLKISYDRSGGTRSVLGTVVEEDEPVQIPESKETPESKSTPFESGLEPWEIEAAQHAGEEETRKYQAELAAREEAAKHKKQEEAEDEALLQREAQQAGAAEPEPAHQSKAPQCLVPSLKGDSLSKARTVLRKAHCRLGKVTRARTTHTARHAAEVVVRQDPARGKRRANSTKVAVTIGDATTPAHKG